MIISNDTYDSTNQVLVVAGSYSEYLNWRKDNALIKSCKYVEQIEDIQGVNGFLAKIILYGNYKNNPLYNTQQMQDLLAEQASPFHLYVN